MSRLWKNDADRGGSNDLIGGILSKQISILFPPGQQFSCTACGKCCRQQWRIRVDPAEAERLESLQAFEQSVKQGYQPLEVVEEQLQLGKKEDSRCVFLQEDNLCQIHGEGGPEVKPAPCRLFPFQLVGTPDGYYVSLSFSCPAVLCGTGELTQHDAEELALTVKAAPHFFPADLKANENVTVCSGVAIPWLAFREWEEAILKLLETPLELTRALSVAVATVAEAIVNEARFEMRVPPGSRVNAVCERMAPMIAVFRNLCIASIEESEDLEKRQELLTKLDCGIGFHSNLLDAIVPAEEKPGTRDLITAEILTRYVHNQLWGKRLTTGPTFMSRLLYLLVSLEVFWFYLSGAKTVTGELHFAPKQVERCFEFLEAQAIYHQDILIPIFLEWENDLLGAAYQESIQV